jgi:hypothetical protein
MVTQNTWNNQVSSAAVTLNGGAVNIGSDNASNAINIGVGTTARTVGICNSAAAHVLTVGSNNGAATTTIQYGTAGLSVTGGSGGQSISISSGGIIKKPLQSLFSAYLSSSTSNNVTGNGTVYTVIFDTELADVSGNYNNSTGVFTAPVTGKYLFTTAIEVTNLGIHSSGSCQIVTTPKTFTGMLLNPATAKVGTTLSFLCSVVVSLSSGNTASATVTISNSTKTVGVLGSSSALTHFSGFLIG